MTPITGPRKRFLDRLRRLLRAVETGVLDLSGDPALFVVGLDGLPRQEAETWLDRVIRDKGRILLGDDGGSAAAAPSPAPLDPGPAGVSPEEKFILWGK